jgi:prepilin-type N-terminal cleavage/methylation domain-containing protein
MHSEQTLTAIRIGKGQHSDAGFSLVELLIAIAIFSIGIMGVVTLQVSAIAGNSGARKIADELVVAEALLEDLTARGQEDYTDADLDPAGNPHAAPLWVPPAYAAAWSVFMVDLNGDGVDDGKRIQLTVSHDGGGNRTATLHHVIPDPDA